ncbi:MAG TPA: ABC transporter ATP-binding protein [Acidimicrobiales bacterium]|nr:ABC transporter ATP-binding protein [Acidimicrobiales bacterium]
MTPKTAIATEGLTKHYGDRVAVDGLDLEVPTGVVAGFVGPNGAGKTTTMAMLLGLVRPTSGQGSVLGHPLSDPSSYLRRVGALIEGPAFYPALTGRQNLTVVATVAGHDRAGIPELLRMVGLEGRADDRFGRYSLGMKQRLGIAAALLGDPGLLILDEPANGLDPAGIHEMRTLLARIARHDRTVFVSSHVLSELEQVCDWLVMIDNGRLLFQGPAAELVGRQVTSLAVGCLTAGDLDVLRRVLLSGGHRVEEVDGELRVGVDGVDPVTLAAAVNRGAFDAGVVLTELRAVRTNLEERYLAMVTGGDR